MLARSKFTNYNTISAVELKYMPKRAKRVPATNPLFLPENIKHFENGIKM